MGGAEATHCSSYTPTLRPNDYLRVGSPVEVCTNEEGWRNVFFAGTVYSPAESETVLGGPSKGLKQVCIKYHDLLAEEGGSEPLKEYIDVEYVRPALPFEEIWDRLETGDVVDAFYLDGWWMGSVKKVLKDGRCIVKFSHPPEEIEFGPSDLRVHWDWFDGIWIRSVSHRQAGPFSKLAGLVEVSLDEIDKRDAWFPGRILGIDGNGKYLVQYGDTNDDSKAGICRTVVDSNFLRPPPPRLKYKNYELFEKVDAYCDSGWWGGVVTLLMEDGKVGVSLKQRKMEGGFKDSELRPHMEWANGKWWILSQGHHLDEGIHTHPSAENFTAPVATMLANGSDTGKGLSFFDRIRSCTSSAGSLGSSQEQFDATVSASPGVAVERCSCFAWGDEDKKITKPIPDAIRNNYRTFSPCLNIGKQPSKPEVKKLLLMNSSEKDVGNKNTAEVTEFPVIVALPCEGFRSGKTNGRSAARLSTTQIASSDKQNGPKVVKMMGRKISGKRKRGRPRKVQVEGMQTLGTNDFHKEDDHASMIPAVGCEDITREHENEMQIEEPDICSSDANVTLGNDDKNSEDSDMVRNESSEMKSNETEVEMEEDELPDLRNDEPLSKWMKAMHSPPRQNKVGNNCATDVATPENIEEHLECAVQKEMQFPPKQDGANTEPSSTASSLQEEKDRSSKNATPEDIVEQVECVVQNTVVQSLSEQDVASTVPSSAGSSLQMEKGSSSGIETPKNPNSPVQITEMAPFVKTSHLWRIIELMEPFQMMPQCPHFKPLTEFKEGVREGLAIGYMAIFSSVVEKTSKLQIDNPERVEVDLLDILTDLEGHGFDVTILQNRVSKLRELKQQHKKMIQENNELNSLVWEDKNEATEIEEQILTNAKLIEELQAKQLELTAARAKISERIESRATRAKETEEGIKLTASLFETIVSSSKECP